MNNQTMDLSILCESHFIVISVNSQVMETVCEVLQCDHYVNEQDRAVVCCVKVASM